MADYRMIVVFKAANDKAARTQAASAAKACNGTVERLTTRVETWGNLKEEEETETAK